MRCFPLFVHARVQSEQEPKSIWLEENRSEQPRRRGGDAAIYKEYSNSEEFSHRKSDTSKEKTLPPAKTRTC